MTNVTQPSTPTEHLPALQEVMREEAGGEVEPLAYTPAEDWNPVEEVRRSAEPIADPQVVSTPDGRVHLVWGENGWIWHAWRSEDGWATPQRLFMGHQPSLDVDAQGGVHLVFAHAFGGRHQIYYTRYVEPLWRLPYEISRTPGLSHRPHVKAGPEERIYVVWEDDTPGFPAIYHAYNPEGYWINAPIPGVRGWRPRLVTAEEVGVHVVWEASMPTRKGDDIYHAQMNATGWSLAENISDTPAGDSALPHAALTASAEIHVVWEERVANRTFIAYAYGRYASWRKPLALVFWGRPQQPCIAISSRGQVHVAWVDDKTVAYRRREAGDEAPWNAPIALDQANGPVAYPYLWVNEQGDVYSTWVRRDGAEYVLCFRFWEIPKERRAHLPFVTVP